jgi:hypothetical protein
MRTDDGLTYWVDEDVPFGFVAGFRLVWRFVVGGVAGQVKFEGSFPKHHRRNLKAR